MTRILLKNMFLVGYLISLAMFLYCAGTRNWHFMWPLLTAIAFQGALFMEHIKFLNRKIEATIDLIDVDKVKPEVKHG